MDPTLPTEQKTRSFVVPLVVVLLGVSLGGAYLYLKTSYPNLFRDVAKKVSYYIPFKNNQAAKTSEPTPIPLPTRSPTPVIPDDGTAGTFKVSQSNHKEPSFTDVRIDPLDAKVGDKLKISVKLISSTPANTIVGNLKTDIGMQQLIFKKISRSSTTESWETEITLKQPVLYNYILHIEGSTTDQSNSFDMALRY